MITTMKKYESNYALERNLEERVNGTYVSIYRGILYDKRLSNQTLGLLVRLISLPLNWKFNKIGLEKLGKDKRAAIDRALMDLVELGYITVEESNGKKNYILTEKPNK